MKKSSIRLSLIIILATLFTFPCLSRSADDPNARRIMQMVDERDDGDNMIGEMEMILIDKNNKERRRHIKSFSKDKGKDKLGVLFFLHPAEVKGTGFLTHSFDEPSKKDDQWLFLPALNKTKRIAAGDKSGSFMGSDFTYSDMSTINLADYDFSFYEKQREIDVEGNKCWLIWAIPRTDDVVKETGYEKSLLFIRQDNYYLIRGKFWMQKGGYIKFLNIKNLKIIDNIWTATELEMKKTRNKQIVHKTILKLKNIKYNQNLNYDLFLPEKLEKGI